MTRAPENGISYNDRTLVLGYTGSGKSELLNHHFSAMRCQRLLIDTKDEWAINGVPRARSVEELDWSAPVMHFAPATNDLGEFDSLFRQAYQRQHLSVCVHELADLCDFRPGATPSAVRDYLSKGRAHGLGLVGASQRPVEMPKRALTEAQHVFILVPRMSGADLDAIAGMVDRPPSDVARLLDALHEKAGDHAFMWFDRARRLFTQCAPLNDTTRKRTIVRKRTVA